MAFLTLSAARPAVARQCFTPGHNNPAGSCATPQARRPLVRSEQARCYRRSSRSLRTSAASEPSVRVDLAPLVRGPTDEKPDYTAIDSTPINKVVMALFRRKMAAEVGEDSDLPGYDGIVDLTQKLNTRFGSAEQTQAATVRILTSLMPQWLYTLFQVMFARPMPGVANILNAVVTKATCEWLMGKCTVNDVELPTGEVKKNWGMKVERCRYLEESGCASVCMNSCKVPTQTFFKESMGLDLEMTPNYDDFSCQFSFGVEAKPQELEDAFKTPCFGQCPRKAANASQETPCHKIQICPSSSLSGEEIA